MLIDEIATTAQDCLRRGSEHSLLPEPLRRRLAQALGESIAESSRRVLRLAVVGEFSTGKSSFLNALLRTDLLSVDDRPTTAVLTRLRYGVTCDLRVGTAADSRSVLPAPYQPLPHDGPPLMLDAQGRWLDSALPKVRESLRSLSTEEGRGGRAVEADHEVRLHFPLPMLKAGLEILDTPGTNVDIQAHRAITKRAVESADACIFLMDARNAFKASEEDFLREVQQSVGKCFFVVNKMDLLDPDEDDVEDVVAEWTTTLEGLVPEGAAQLYLVSSLPAGSLNERAKAFRSRLEVLRSDILAFMHQNRQRMIVQALMGRLRATSQEMGEESVRQRTECEDRLAVLQAARLTEPAVVTNRIATNALDAVRAERARVAAGVATLITQHKRTIIANFCAQLATYPDAAKVKENAGRDSGTGLDWFAGALQRDLKKNYDLILRSAAEEVLSGFRELYASLPFKASPRHATSESIMGGLGALPVSSEQLSAQVQGRLRAATGGQIAGAAAGAAVGMMLLGPVGIGLWKVGEALFAKSKETLIEEAREEFAKALDAAGGSLLPQLQGCFVGEQSPIERHLRLIVSTEVENFAKVAQAAVDAHRQHERAIEAQIREIEAVRRDLATNADRLQIADDQLRASLATAQVAEGGTKSALVVDRIQQLATLCEQAVQLARSGSLAEAMAELDELEDASSATPSLASERAGGLDAHQLLRRARATCLAPHLDEARLVKPLYLLRLLAGREALVAVIPAPWLARLQEGVPPLFATLWWLALSGHPKCVDAAWTRAWFPRAAPLAQIAAGHGGLTQSPACQFALVSTLRAMPVTQRGGLHQRLASMREESDESLRPVAEEVYAAFERAMVETARLDAVDKAAALALAKAEEEKRRRTRLVGIAIAAGAMVLVAGTFVLVGGGVLLASVSPNVAGPPSGVSVAAEAPLPPGEPGILAPTPTPARKSKTVPRAAPAASSVIELDGNAPKKRDPEPTLRSPAPADDPAASGTEIGMVHQPKGRSVVLGEDAAISAALTGNTPPCTVKLRYQAGGDWAARSMSSDDGRDYETTLRVADELGDDLKYYIVAKCENGRTSAGSSEQPFILSVL